MKYILSLLLIGMSSLACAQSVILKNGANLQVNSSSPYLTVTDSNGKVLYVSVDPTPSPTPTPVPTTTTLPPPTPTPTPVPTTTTLPPPTPTPAPSAKEVPGPSASLLANQGYSLGIGTIYQCVRNFYVDGSKGKDTNAGTQSAPWATIAAADSSARQGGDCINVAAGIYPTAGMSFSHGGSAATPTGYVSYKCQALGACHIQYTGSAGGHMWMLNGSNYLVIDGFEIDGNETTTYGGLADSCIVGIQLSQYGFNTSHHVWILNNKIHSCNLAGLTFQSTEYVFALHNEVYNNSFTSGYQGSGIGFVIMQPLGSGANGETVNPNLFPAYTQTAQDKTYAPFHIITAFNVVHDNGCTSCLGATAALTTTGNSHSSTLIDGMASVTGLVAGQLAQGPGIQPFTYVQTISGKSVTLTRPMTATGTKVTFNFAKLVSGHTDGNGIIMDTWDGGIGGSDKSYPSQALVLGNVAYSNGGRGIHIFAASNVTVANNSAYGNGLDLWNNSYYLSDLSQSGGANNVWVNNIAQSIMSIANPACGQYCGARNSPLVAGDGRGDVSMNNTYLHNITFGANGVQLFNNDVNYYLTANNKSADPLYTSPTTSVFTLKSTSPGIGYAQPESYVPAWMTNSGSYQ